MMVSLLISNRVVCADQIVDFDNFLILRNVICSYTIVRIAGFNDIPSGEASTIDLSAVS